MGLRVDLADLPAAQEATYAFELRGTKGYDYQVMREHCRIATQGGAPSWFDRQGNTFRSSIETRRALAANALALALWPVTSDSRPWRGFYQTSNPIASIRPRCAKCRIRTRARACTATAAMPPACFASSTTARADTCRSSCKPLCPGEIEVTPVRLQNKLSLKFIQQGEQAGALTLGPHSMSDGTLRMLGLLAAVLQPRRPSVLIVEEPEATIHPGALGAILDVLRVAASSAQTIITMHSPDILEARWIEDRHLRIVSWADGATCVKDTAAHPHPESPRGAKSVLAAMMHAGYSETKHQPAFSALFCMAAAYARCRSFRKLAGSFGRMMGGPETNPPAWPSVSWRPRPV